MTKYSHRILLKPLEGSRTGGVHADVYLPPKPSKAPIAIAIHGGAFSLGASDEIPMQQVDWLLNEGFAVVSLEHRLAPQVEFPAIRHDILDGYKWILHDMNKAIGEDLDTTRVLAMGWGSGGLAALLLAHNSIKAGLPRLKAILVTYPLTEQDTLNAKHRAEWRAGVSEEEYESIKEFLDEPIETSFVPPPEDTLNPPARVKWLKSTLHAWLHGHDAPFAHNTSPVNNVIPDFPPTFIVIATADEIIPPAQSYHLYEKLKEHGVDCAIGEAKGMGHSPDENPSFTGREGQKWWDEAILPGLKWVAERTKR